MLLFPVVVALLTISGMKGEDEKFKRDPGFYGEYKHVGCFVDKASRAIPDKLWTYHLMSPAEKVKRCSELAEKHGYKVFSVQNGGQCFSGPSADKTYDKYGASSHCSNGVGGSWANDVYAFPEKYHIGCYKDKEQGRAFPQYLGQFPAESAVTKCSALAKENKFPIYAVQFGGECWTGPLSEQEFDKYGKATNCGEDGVGGRLANDVYSFKPYRHVGCFKDQLFPHAITWLIGTYFPSTAVSHCAYEAHKKGYKAFGVQYGGQCYGSNSAHHESSYGRYGKADNCGGGVGGFFANDVYMFY